jgi:hypothetical protein
MYTACALCGSSHIIPAVRLEDDHEHGWAAREHAVYIATKPEAVLFQGIVSSRIRAFICGACGYTALFADEPEQLWQAYQEFRATSRPKR